MFLFIFFSNILLLFIFLFYLPLLIYHLTLRHSVIEVKKKTIVNTKNTVIKINITFHNVDIKKKNKSYLQST